jgi:hypothetical protein
MTLSIERLKIGAEAEVWPSEFMASDTSMPMLACVVCGFDCTHVEGAHTSFGTDEFEGGHTYTGTTASGVRQGWRRDALVIDIICEGGHRFQLIIQQHKGSSLMRAKRLPDTVYVVADE